MGGKGGAAIYKVKFEDSELSEVSTLNRSLELVLQKLPQRTAAVG